MAIDASKGNIVDRNTFIDNGAGAIMLYRNCEEQQRPARFQNSDYNQIVGNRFFRERIGIWTASRQSANLNGWWNCSANPMYEARRTVAPRTLKIGSAESVNGGRNLAWVPLVRLSGQFFMADMHQYN